MGNRSLAVTGPKTGDMACKEIDVGCAIRPQTNVQIEKTQSQFVT